MIYKGKILDYYTIYKGRIHGSYMIYKGKIYDSFMIYITSAKLIITMRKR